MTNTQKEPEFLYHYTSINTLALILSNRSICFNNLLNVDDLEEVETSDLDKFGKFCCVSCWSSDAKESIPLWNMYTPNMSGVRIKLPLFPFKKYHFKINEIENSEPIDTFINMHEFINSDNSLIANFYPELIKVEYTENNDLLYPKIKSVNTTTNTVETTYSFKDLGKYKRTNWSFQNEWRYKIIVCPYSYKELKNCKTHEEHQALTLRFENPHQVVPCDTFFLELDETCFKSMEILLGPKTTYADEIIVNSLIEKYCPTALVSKSSLKIK